MHLLPPPLLLVILITSFNKASTLRTYDTLFRLILSLLTVSSTQPWFSIVNLYGGPGSQINIHPSSSSAYSDRNSLWVIQNYGSTNAVSSPFPNAIIPFIEGLNTALISAQPQTAFGAYINYVDPSLTAAQAHSLYFDAPTYAKLSAIKKVVDPKKVFWNPQAVGN